MARERITMTNLERLVGQINHATGSPAEPYSRDESGRPGPYNVGHYMLSGAYGGHKLVRITSETGGHSDISPGGHIGKRALFDWLGAYLAGIHEGKLAGQRQG